MKKLLALILALTLWPYDFAQAGTPTTHYGWPNPTNGADADTWGTQINTALTGIDTTMYGKLDLTGGTLTGKIVFVAPTTGGASLTLPSGVAPTSPSTGDLWNASGLVKFYNGSATKQIAFIDDAITGSAATLTTGRVISLTGDATATCPSFNGSSAIACAVTGVQAAKLTTARAITASGDAAWTVNFDGSAGASAALTLATVNSNTGSFGSTSAVPVITLDGKGRVTAATTAALGTAAVAATGTSGHTLGFLDGANTYSGSATFSNAVTLAAGTTVLAPLKFTSGTSLTSPAAGAVEWDGTNLFLTQTTGPTRKTVAYLDSTLSGNTTGSAAKWTTSRVISLTGAVTSTCPALDGSAAISCSTTLAAGQAVTNIGYTPANIAGDTFTGKLNIKASAAGGAGVNVTPGTAPTSPVNGDFWSDSTGFYGRVNGITLTLATTSSTAVNSFNTRTGAVVLTAADVSGVGGLLASNNLSDVTAATARTNLGLVASATTDTTNASNISAGTLASARGGAGTINGILKANGSGVVSLAVSSTDYAPATSGSSLLKANGTGGFSSAVSATDYAPATSGSAILKGNGAGGFSSAASGTDYAPATATTSVLKGNGSGGFSAAACGDLTNGATGCSTATGTSGATIPVLNVANTWGAKQTLFTSTTGAASVAIPTGTAPTSPASGDIWVDTNLIRYRTSGASTKTVAFSDSNITGSAATLTTARTIALTGDVTYTSPAFNGSADVTAAATLSATGVSAATYGDSLNVSQVTLDAKGRATAASNVAIATMVGDSGSGGTKGLVPAPATGDSGKVLTGAGTFQPVGAHAWVKFNASGTVLASYGISAVTRTSAGNYNITFSTAFSSADYACVANARRAGAAFIIVAGDQANAPTSSIWYLVTQNTSGAVDATETYVACFGN